MAVLKSDDNKELVVTCVCCGGFGCGEGIHIKVNENLGDYAYMTYINSNFYRDQNGIIRTLTHKLRKIWAIIRNKDFYYSDIIMNKDDFEVFKSWINQF